MANPYRTASELGNYRREVTPDSSFRSPALMSGTLDGNPPLATSIPEYTRELLCKELDVITSRMNTQDQNHQAVDRRVQDIIQDIGYLRVGFDQHSAKQHTDIQKMWANVEQLRTTVGNKSFLFEDYNRAVNAANDELHSLAFKVRWLEEISTRLSGSLEEQAAEIDRLKGIVLRLGGDPNQ